MGIWWFWARKFVQFKRVWICCFLRYLILDASHRYILHVTVISKQWEAVKVRQKRKTIYRKMYFLGTLVLVCTWKAVTPYIELIRCIDFVLALFMLAWWVVNILVNKDSIYNCASESIGMLSWILISSLLMYYKFWSLQI